jgi:disulfide bond formation protein DsbB
MNLQRIFNLLFIFILSFILIGGYIFQIIVREDPCTLCFLQRIGMTGIAIALLMNLRFGIKVEHYGLAILSALLGRVVSLNQIGLHIHPKINTFGTPVFGLQLYVWSFIVFNCSVFACAILLIMYGFTKEKDHQAAWGPLEKGAFSLVLLITLGNLINSLIDCSFLSCP